MIRECTETDREILGGYLEEDSYGQAILHLIDEFGFEQKFQSVYMDIEEEQCKGVFTCVTQTLMLEQWSAMRSRLVRRSVRINPISIVHSPERRRLT